MLYLSYAGYADGNVETLEATFVGTETEFTLTIPKTAVHSGLEYLRFCPALTESTGDGYFVIPSGARGFLTRFLPREDQNAYFYCNLPMFGVKNERGSFIVIVEGMAWTHQVLVSCQAGVYTICPNFFFRHDALPDEDFSIRVLHLQKGDGYNEMAKAYRAYKIRTCGVKKLKDRLTPQLEYAAASMELRVRLGWKPVPTPVEEQKPETEPPMKVKITFEKLINLMDRMYEQGVRRVQFCLVGWNMRGHDGRYPQLFPVEEALGGETKLREAIAHAQSLGYAIVCHTNSSDCYRIADCFSEDDVLKYADGELQKNTCWSGGQMYNLSPFAALERARTDLPQVAAFGFSGLHYIDVLSVVLPRWGKDARGIVSIKDCIACWKKIMTIAHDEFGGFASEGGFDFCAEELDFGLYANFDMYQPLREFEDEIIPFWQLIYHGLIMSNPSTDLVNLPFVSREKQLRFVEYGGRPAMYYYARFVDQTGDRKNWMGTDDLTCDAEEDTAAGIQAIKQMQDEYDKLWDLQYCLMERYERLTDNVTMVAYDNGTRIVTNYGNEPFLLEGVTVQPMEYARINETKE